MPGEPLEDIKVLTSRRDYEFSADDLRLSALCTKPVEERLNALFQFRTSVMGTPMPTFGVVPMTFPAGFVFDVGFWVSPDGKLVTIRFIHFEQERIVIDVAGDSSAITPVYEAMRAALEDLQTPDGSALIGQPKEVREYSELTARCNFPLEKIVAPKVTGLVTRTAGKRRRGTQMILVPTVSLQPIPVGDAYGGAAPTNEAHTFTLTVRARTKPEDRICFSGAPLDSEAHIAYLHQLASALASQE